MADGYDSTTQQTEQERQAREQEREARAHLGHNGRHRHEEETSGGGWIGFAGVMIAIVGILNIIYGIAAISDSKFFVHGTSYIISGLNTYGWILLVTGVIQFCTALGILAGAEWARWVGIFIAGLNAIFQLVFVPAYPVLSVSLFAVDVFIIYGLAAYGGRQHGRLV